MCNKLFLAVALLWLTASPAAASSQLFYFEAQEVFGYSSALHRTIPYSVSPDAVMQKPSVGFDYVKRFSGDTGDIATLSVQGRLALKHFDLFDREKSDSIQWEPQLHNAFLKVKTPYSYIWVGHERPAFGFASYFDSHGLLLRTLSLMGFGYERDWGVGADKDFAWGDASASVTTGTGMPIYTSNEGTLLNGNYMVAARLSYGVLTRDNYNAGFSLGGGKTLATIGYTVVDPEPQRMQMAGADLSVLQDNFEHRMELMGGTRLGKDVRALSYRFGIVLDEEGRGIIEAQQAYWKSDRDENTPFALCLSYRITSKLTVRTAYEHDRLMNDNRFLAQLYFYGPL